MEKVKEIFGGEKKRDEPREGEYGYGHHGTAVGEAEYAGQGQQRRGQEYERETPGYGGGSTERSGYSGVTGRERGTDYGGTSTTGYGGTGSTGYGGGTGTTGYGGETGPSGYGTFGSGEGRTGHRHGKHEETTGYGRTTGYGGTTGGGTTGYGTVRGTEYERGTAGYGEGEVGERHGERGSDERAYGERAGGIGYGEERKTEEEKMQKEYEGHKRGERIGEAIAAGAAAYAAHERHERKEDEEDIKRREREAEGGQKKHGWFG
ncbi:hypothetical protein CLOM_g23606 [Closterium sp. NIES-68]|nr:hypothetical protein CLOM_g23606 [Closterium sp. NIES-68]GJP83321.1 hypothetical protein CLOP_g13483 [Closterium sp. NIES-67]